MTDNVVQSTSRMTERITTDKITKTYFITRNLENELPIEFVYSKNPRYITFQSCRATCDGFMDGETEVHASFIQRDNYCDSMVWYCNIMPPDDNRKYEYIGSQRNFKIWFIDGTGKEIIPDNFTIFLKLEF